MRCAVIHLQSNGKILLEVSATERKVDEMVIVWFAIGLLVLCIIEDRLWFKRWAARMIARIEK